MVLIRSKSITPQINQSTFTARSGNQNIELAKSLIQNLNKEHIFEQANFQFYNVKYNKNSQTKIVLSFETTFSKQVI